MTREEVQELKKALVATALYYGETIPDQALPMYAADLEDLQLELVLAALQAYRRNGKNRRRPLPADLRSLVLGDGSGDGRARDIAARLHGALIKYGMDWPAGSWLGGSRGYDGNGERWATWREAAIAELGGADALDVLTRLGGWQGYYQYANFSEPTTVAAQVRDLAASVARLERGPALPSGSPPRALQAATEPATNEIVRGLAQSMTPRQSE